MEVQNVKTGSIKPYAKNPRDNEKAVDEVAKSLESYGWDAHERYMQWLQCNILNIAKTKISPIPIN